MKQLKAKLLAGVLSVAMVIGTFAGVGPLVAKAATSYETELTVRAGKALSGVELVFEKDGETYAFDTTDKSGEATLDDNGLMEMFFADQDAGGEGT